MSRRDVTCAHDAGGAVVALRRAVAARMRPALVAGVLLACAGLATACGGPSTAPGGQVIAGTWGGDGVQMVTTAHDVSVEFDCAHGSVAQALTVDGRGRFDVAGVFVLEHGGPVRVDAPPDSHPARYAGTVNGAAMNLTVTTTDDNRVVGSFVLVLGQSGRVVKCL
jgi:hypothetical protein